MTDEFARLLGSPLARPASESGPPGGADRGTHSPAFVGRVFAQTAVPTSVNRVFLVHPVTVLGSEQEGGPGSLVVDTSTTVAVYVIGLQAPVVGDDLICRFVSHRWVAEGRTKSRSQKV